MFLSDTHKEAAGEPAAYLRKVFSWLQLHRLLR